MSLIHILMGSISLAPIKEQTMENLYNQIEELGKTRSVRRTHHRDKQSFGDFVEGAVITFFMRHWSVNPINLGGPSPFDFEIIRDGKESFLVEVKSHNNDWDLPYFLYEVEDRGWPPCHFGAMMKGAPAGKEYFISVDCNLRKGGTLHIYPAREIAKWCNLQTARSTKVNTRCVEVPWNGTEIKGKKKIQLDEDIWECIVRWKNKHSSVAT